MKSYYRVMLGRQSMHAADCFAEGYIGVDFDIAQDLTNELPDDWRQFNVKFRPIFLEVHPDKSKIAAGLACGFLWTVAKGIRKGDIVLCPDGTGTYHVGEVSSDYLYAPGTALPHRRKVTWLDQTIVRVDMSDALKSATKSIGTISNITGHGDEVERFIGGSAPSTATPTSSNEAIDDPAAFVLEKHLEDFLVQNWEQTDLGKEYDIYTEGDEVAGQQYPTDTGPMDILAIKKDRSELLVVELKKGRASDAVVGQILRYMGYVLQELAEPNQAVKGIIIALDDDQRIRRALAASPNISFFRYQVSFKLVKA